MHIGERLQVGGAELIVTQPRLPCYKLALRFKRADMVRRFLASRRTGFYFAVLCEGAVASGDPISLLACDRGRVPVADVTRVFALERDDLATMRKLVALPALPQGWRAHFADQLAEKGI